MKMYNNEIATTGVVAGIMVFIIIVVGILSFLMISSTFDDHYKPAIKDPTNATGIYVNNTTPYESVKVIQHGFFDNIPVAILLGFLLAVIIMIILVMTILKRGD
jgi:hypothetical protein